MSLSEIKAAVEALSPAEMTELATFILARENERWDRQIDADFSPNGPLRTVLEEVQEDIHAGRLREMP